MHEQQMKENEGVTIDLGRVVQALIKWVWLIVAVAIIFGAVSWVISATMITPTYRTSFTAYVNNKIEISGTGGSTTTSDLNASIALAYVYGKIIMSRTVLTEAASLCGFDDLDYEELSDMVSVSISNTTAIIDVYVTATDPVKATAFAGAIADVAPGEVSRVVDNSSMRIVDEPVMPEEKFAPSNALNAVLGAMIGIVVAVVAVVVLELMNDYVQSSEELEKRYNVITIGVIPDMDQAERMHGNYSYARAGGRKK